jgi:periplasmic divalent cation tolerance protein
VALGDYLVVLTTLGSLADARELLRRLVDERLVACGTILPGVTSIYRWSGSVTEESEVVVLLKTHKRRWKALQQAVAAHHPYEVPELLALPVTAGLDRYLGWVSLETAGGEG